MLKEVDNVKQNPKSFFRRWFSDDYFDIIIWLKYCNKIFGFQLCYNKLNNEHSLTWNEDNRFQHNKIDDGDISFHIKRSPVLIPDGVVPIKEIIEEFIKRNKNIDKDISIFILNKLKSFNI